MTMKKLSLILTILILIVAGCIGVSAFNCGESFVITHTTANGVAPVTKTVTYGTVLTDLTGSDKCWITQNLGATNQASSATDSTEASAGWYWQFNRKQGYKYDGTTRTPSTTWITPINEELNWQAANDPCTIELGQGWRLPTRAEWYNADSTGAWANSGNTFASVLKLHVAGYLIDTTGGLATRGTHGRCWSRIRSSNPDFSRTYGDALVFYSSFSVVNGNKKANGYSVRCINDLSANGDPCSANEDCISNYCRTDLDGVGKLCADSSQCVYSDTIRDNDYSICYNNDDYTCNSGTWGSEDCGANTACGYYQDISSVCSAGSCISCPTSCASDSDCDAGMSCVENSCSFTIPIHFDYISDPETTTFSEVENISAVENLTLATSLGIISFGDSIVNAKGQDYDSHVKIEDRFIFVNSSALDSTFNNSATLTFENVNCAAPYVFYSATKTNRLAILSENNQCFAPRCTNIQCADSTLTVDVLSFSGYAAESDANLSIDADDPKLIDQDVNFTAEYLNVSNGLSISGATCTIYFTDGNYPMAEGTDIYTYNRTFSTEGIKEYNVTCSKTGFSTLTAFDNATIGISDIPEFSMITLGLGLVAVLGGLIVIRKKR